jgi:hypothetical protein
MTPKTAIHTQSTRLISSRAVVSHGRCDISPFPLEILLDRLCSGRFVTLGDDVIVDGSQGSWSISTPPNDGWIHRTDHPNDGDLLRVSFERDQSQPPRMRAIGLVAWAMTIRDSPSHADEVSEAADQARTLLDVLAESSEAIAGLHEAQLWIYPPTTPRDTPTCGISMPDGSLLGPSPATSAAVARLRPIMSLLPGSVVSIHSAFWQRMVTSDPGRCPAPADLAPFS